VTIRGRIAFVSAVAVAVAVVLISIGAFAGARRQLMAEIDGSLVARSERVSELRPGALLAVLGIGRSGSQGNRIVPPRPGDFDTSYYQVILGDGRVFNVGDDDLVLPRPSSEDLDPDGPTLRSEWVDGLHVRIVTTVRTPGQVALQIARPLAEMDTVLRRISILLAVGSAIGIVLAGGLGLVTAKYAVAPIGALAAEVGEIAGSQVFSRRVAVAGTDEVAELSREFNRLLDELESSKQEQVRLVRDAGHELRTPLTALRTNLEILQRHEVEPEERQAILAAAHAEVEELAALVDEVVDLAADGHEEETASSVVLREVAASVAERLGRRRGREITVVADGSVVDGRRSALERALFNIVGNSDKFALPETSIGIEVVDGAVTVTDDGPGFDAHDLPHVFERFYRSDAARSQPGSGLGLAIVRQIVEDHGGEVFARNRPSGGAEVGFRLTNEE